MYGIIHTTDNSCLFWNTISMLGKIVLISICAFLVSFTGISFASDKGVQLPDFGDEANISITPEEGRKIGRQFYQELLRKNYVELDPLLSEYLDNLGNKLVSYSDAPGEKFTFFLIPADVANAFATPGAYVGLFEGLVLLAQSEDEIASVLSHEIAHVTQNHMARRSSLMKKVTVPILLGMLGVIAASSGNGNATGAAVMGGVGLLQQKSINYTRANEYEADRIGIQTLHRAGYDPKAMAMFFGRMQQLSRNFGKIPPEILLTHPVNTSRIAEAKARADHLKTQTLSAQEQQARMRYFRFMQERMRVNLARNAAEAISYYKMIIKNGNKLKDEEKYGYSVALATTGAIDQTKELIEQIDPEYVEIPLIIEKTSAFLSANRIEEAIDSILPAIEEYPRNYPINRLYVDILLQSQELENLQKARNIVSQLQQRRPDDVELYRIRGRIESKLEHPIIAMQNLAIADFKLGNHLAAIRRLKQLLHDDPTPYQKARISARIEEIRSSLDKKELKKLDKKLDRKPDENDDE